MIAVSCVPPDTVSFYPLVPYTATPDRPPNHPTPRSHNGRSLGKAFVRAQGRGTGRYRVIAPQGLECRVGVDEESQVVEVFPRGTVLQVSQVS